MEGSVSFDRASEFYDRTRALSAPVMERLLDTAASELGGRHTLEVGVGTGRFALPLAGRGVDVTGIDISETMLARLVRNAGKQPIPLAVADAARLPFADGSFEAAFGVHVLHLISEWGTVLDELARVVAGSGPILVDVGSWGVGEWKALTVIFSEAAGIPHAHPGVNDPADLDRAMEARGFSVHVHAPVVEATSWSYRDLIRSLEEGIYSFTWRTDQSGRARGASAVRAWLAARNRGPDDQIEMRFNITWRSYRRIPRQEHPL
ncbi:MAG: class I SAM-dependent methyltransferase [Actinomycetota bacterium]